MVSEETPCSGGGSHGLLLESEAVSLSPLTTSGRDMDPQSHNLLIAISGQSTLSSKCLLSGPCGSNGDQDRWSLPSFPAQTTVQVLDGKQLPARKTAMSPPHVKKLLLRQRPDPSKPPRTSQVVRTRPPCKSPGVLPMELARALPSPPHRFLPVADFWAVRSWDRQNAFPSLHTWLTAQA